MIPTFTLPLFAMGQAKLLVEFTDYVRYAIPIRNQEVRAHL